MKINIKKAPRILIFGKICFISQKHQLPTHLPKKKPHLSILTTPKMNFPRLFDVLNILVLFLGASALRTWKHSPSSTSHASLTIDMLPDRPRLSYLSPAQLIHEVATVVSKTLPQNKFPETISRIEKYKLLERRSALQGLDREKIAGMIWETYELEVEKLKVAEKKKKECVTERKRGTEKDETQGGSWGVSEAFGWWTGKANVEDDEGNGEGKAGAVVCKDTTEGSMDS